MAVKQGTQRKGAAAGKDDGSDDWSAAEIAEHHALLEAELDRLTAELARAEAGLNGLIRDTQDMAGDDQADVGSKAIEREHEVAVAQNTRDMLAQTKHALDRLEANQHSVCESCGGTIPKLRVQAFPRATLCVTCKANQKNR
ncbi:TraR/DksA family transcriptional regulator [Arsenicicoccus piscis]|uniref:Zinc finger DksA/TraR C4-type domain-containing protein n=1 Tax=Arsenicicoccus piscis TaxID=673954 RepID=A0ABQ6HMX1_9MICO|nr:TraR/DksA family transcriptional regulator [Arsenicicoccus piscis]MCH8627096.1 TraR/DksA family transcriptional regulator [Arsenicicoccus piscis]GMA18960.1 hypothetical protein GCM10025862_09810 [Arsenicicoccus piscis]